MQIKIIMRFYYISITMAEFKMTYNIKHCQVRNNLKIASGNGK